MPFFLLAVGEKERYCVNVQKEYVATPGGAYYQISVQGEPSSFNFVSLGYGYERPYRLIYAGNGEYLSVCKFEPKLLFDSETGAPMSKFLFDFLAETT